jgi:nucleoside-diphosphate-sugar epimerase
MRVLVTGHTGYIGSVLTPLLAAAGHEVVGLDSHLFAPCLLPGQPLPPAIPEIAKDLRDLAPGDLDGFDAVLHLAGLSNDPLGNLDAALTVEINEEASLHHARLAKSAAFNPVTAYGLSKVRFEQALHALADDSFSPSYLRNATAYGVSPRMRVDLVLNNLVAWAVTAGRIHLMSDGTPWRPLVHIEDISRAFLAVLEAPRETVHDQAWNVGRTADNYRIRELAEIVAETVPGCAITYAEGAGPDKRCYRVDCGKIARLLPAFQPQWDARKGAREIHAAYLRAGLTAEDFQGPRYVRLGRIRQLQEEGRLDAALRWTGEVPAGRESAAGEAAAAVR